MLKYKEKYLLPKFEVVILRNTIRENHKYSWVKNKRSKLIAMIF